MHQFVIVAFVESAMQGIVGKALARHWQRNEQCMLLISTSTGVIGKCRRDPKLLSYTLEYTKSLISYRNHYNCTVNVMKQEGSRCFILFVLAMDVFHMLCDFLSILCYIECLLFLSFSVLSSCLCYYPLSWYLHCPILKWRAGMHQKTLNIWVALPLFF